MFSDFYPRSPRGERRGLCHVGHGVDVLFLSTLPARGATLYIRVAAGCTTHFYPRSPRGERLHFWDLRAPSRRFLSTLPARGATSGAFFLGSSNSISIHAPREGSDGGSILRRWSPGYFYPRSPRGERLPGEADFPPVHLISIHAPREGSDLRILARFCIVKRFLSTLPARGATYTAECARVCTEFLSTLPARGATMHRANVCDNGYISIHAPREGSDVVENQGPARQGEISIHAPREGSD